MTDSAQHIKDAYARRDATKGDRYAWYQPDVINQDVARQAALRRVLHKAFGTDLSSLDVLDVGCGTGSLLRSLIELGVSPSRCTGIELLSNRIESAVSMSHPAMQWHVGGLDVLASSQLFDLVTAWTVLSSVICEDERRSLIDAMWSRVKPGGWMQVFDFRFDNPRNPDVRKVRNADFASIDPTPIACIRKSLILPPPLARRLCRVHACFDVVLAGVMPAIRSHQLCMMRKPIPS